MKQKESLSSNSAKKRRILIGCAIGGVAVIMTGAGIGVGYAIWHSKNSGDTDPRNSLTIEYSRSFDLTGMEPVSITPTVKTSSGVEISNASFLHSGAVPTDLQFNDSNGIISGTPSNIAASDSFVVYVFAIVDDILVSGARSFDWNITPHPIQPITNANLNTLREDIFVTSICLDGVSCLLAEGELNAQWSKNNVIDSLFISHYPAFGDGVFFTMSDRTGEYIFLYTASAWASDTNITSNTGMTYRWVQATKTLSISETGNVSVASVSADWNTNIIGGTFSGFTF